MKQEPTVRQAIFLATNDISEVLYGGAAGGGKSSALLLSALQYADVPGYSAILFRKTYADLALPGALMDRAHEWLGETDARWDGTDKRWRFPSGANLTFGYLDKVNDHFRYQSSEFQFVGFDEVTQFAEKQYRYLFSRLRRLATALVPVRMRAASNPGGVGHEWVKRRFIKQASSDRLFIPARLSDNPHLDQAGYIASLNQLDPVTRAQLLAGDWDAYQGGRFRREWFRRYRESQDFYLLAGREAHSAPKADCWTFVTVDPAASEKETADYTVIGVFAVTPLRDLIILDVIRGQFGIEQIVPRLAAACQRYQPAWVGIEATGFQWGIVFAARRHPSIPTVKGMEPEGKGKLVRATPAIIRCEQGQLFFPESAEWLEDVEAELVQFTGTGEDAHDDIVDCIAYAVQELDRFGITSYPSAEDNSTAADRDESPSWDQRNRDQGRFEGGHGLFGRR